MENLKKRLDTQINGDYSVEALTAMRIRAKQQVQSKQAKKKHAKAAADIYPGNCV